MTVLCGTDFSDGARAAARVAAGLARRLDLPLTLLHVIDARGAGQLRDPIGDNSEVESSRARFHEEVEALGWEFGIAIEPQTERGAADEVLVAFAIRIGARILVLGPHGAERHDHRLLGGVVERVAQASPLPVLVARDGGRIETWAAGGPTLRVVVGVEQTPASRAAVRWAEGLRRIGPCEITITQIVWPAEAHHRMNAPSPIPLDRLRPEVEQNLLRELRQWAADDTGPGETSFVVRPGWGRVDSHLIQLAAEYNVDLLVVGTHQRAGVARLWQGSVSRGVLHGAPVNVACVPSGRPTAAESSPNTPAASDHKGAL